MTRPLVTLAAALLPALVLACGGDDGDGGQLTGITPVGTKESTPTPGPSSGGPAVAPDPVTPELDEELTAITTGDLQATIGPGGTYEIDPEALAAAAGASDVCENFQFDFSWQIVDPYPVTGVALTWLFDSEQGSVEVASGPAGNQAVGCGSLTARNGGAAPLSVAVKYAIGARQ